MIGGKMIRKLETNDIDEVMNIWLETNIKAHKFIDKKYWENNYNEVKKGILNADTYVFEKNNQIMGFVGIIDGYIAGIFVKESMQRNGIGKQLINKSKEKYKKLTLNVYEKNKQAIKFYQNQGFNIVNKSIDEQTKEIELFMEWTKK